MKFQPRWKWFGHLCIAILCSMSYLSAILLLGWLSRLIRARVFVAKTEVKEYPNWFFREKQSDSLLAGVKANLFEGVQMLLAVFLLTGWSTGLMTISWEMGWLNSFHKGYEISYLGPTLALTGLLTFVATMIYVPLAQVHLATTGDIQSFFDVRLITQLIRLRLFRVYLLSLTYLGFGWVLEILKTIPYFFDILLPGWSDASDTYQRFFLLAYYSGCSAWLVFGLIITRLMAARIYRSGLKQLLRSEHLRREELHKRLQSIVGVEDDREEKSHVTSPGWFPFSFLFLSLICVWLLFGIKTYLGEFLNYHPFVGFFNQPLVQLPCVNYIPLR